MSGAVYVAVSGEGGTLVFGAARFGSRSLMMPHSELRGTLLAACGFVNLSTVTPKELLQNALNEQFADSTGQAIRIALLGSGMGLNEEHFRSTFTRPIPVEVRELLAFASGFSIGSTEVQFTEHHMQGFDAFFPDWMELCGDGCGNFWVAEIQDETNEWNPVWFVCHDPPVVLRVADNLSDFLEQVLDCHRVQPRRSVNWFAQSHDRAMEIWNGRGLKPIEMPDACRSSDGKIAELGRACRGTGRLLIFEIARAAADSRGKRLTCMRIRSGRGR